jgi:hypothetical protein
MNPTSKVKRLLEELCQQHGMSVNKIIEVARGGARRRVQGAPHRGL